MNLKRAKALRHQLTEKWREKVYVFLNRKNQDGSPFLTQYLSPKCGRYFYKMLKKAVSHATHV